MQACSVVANNTNVFENHAMWKSWYLKRSDGRTAVGLWPCQAATQVLGTLGVCFGVCCSESVEGTGGGGKGHGDGPSAFSAAMSPQGSWHKYRQASFHCAPLSRPHRCCLLHKLKTFYQQKDHNSLSCGGLEPSLRSPQAACAALSSAFEPWLSVRLCCDLVLSPSPTVLLPCSQRPASLLLCLLVSQ